nr:uncharacterized protein LOC117856292 [Setaria viridis]
MGKKPENTQGQAAATSKLIGKADDSTHGGDEATSGEVVTTAKDTVVSVTTVEELQVGVPLVKLGIAVSESVVLAPAGPELAALVSAGPELAALAPAGLELAAGGASKVTDVAKTPVVAAGALLSNVIAGGFCEDIVRDPVVPSTQLAVTGKKHVRLPPRSSRDAEDTIPVDAEVESGVPTTLSGPLVDLTMDDAPEVDTNRLGATISMLQEVIRSVESPAVPSSSGGVPSSMTVGGTLALVDMTKVDEVGAQGAVLGGAPGPQIAKDTKGPVQCSSYRRSRSFEELFRAFRTYMTEPKEMLGPSRSEMILCNEWRN